MSSLLRLSPLIPFGILNYIFSITAITFKDFVVGSIGIVPGTFAFVLVGALNGSTVSNREHGDEEDGVKWILFIVGGVATLIAFAFITRTLHTILSRIKNICSKNQTNPE